MNTRLRFLTRHEARRDTKHKLPRWSLIGLVFLMLLSASLLPASAQTSTAQKPAAASISEASVRAHTRFLADDLLEGRGPGGRGGELAAKYIAAQFERSGLRGAGAGGSFFQPVALTGVKADPSITLKTNRGSDAQIFKFGDDFVAHTGAQTADVMVRGELVFVGYGIDAPNQKWNDYKLDPADYKDKILVMMVNDPPATPAEPNLFGGRALTYYGRWTYKYEEAARRGAAGAILIHTNESAGYPWSVVRTSNGSWRYDIRRQTGDSTAFLKMRAWITDDAAKRLISAAGFNLDELRRQAASRDFKPVRLNVEAAVDLRSEVQQLAAPNVVAMLPGSDAKLRDEYVVYTAHWDHLGIGEPNSKGDRIYNGAVDNATGVASVLAIAEQFARLPENQRPRRSIMFVITTAEEQGLLGAAWFVEHPLVPLARIAANINLDAMNILGQTRDFAPLGYERSSLKSIVEAVAREHNMTVAPDSRPEQGLFFRSDHFPFAKAGVPAISMNSGQDFVGRPAGWGAEQFRVFNTANYHQPSDEYSEAWDVRGMLQQAELALAIGRRVADGAEMPRYNEADEFARKK